MQLSIDKMKLTRIELSTFFPECCSFTFIMKTLTPEEFLRLVWPKKLLTHETLELRLIERTSKKVKREFSSSVDDFLKRAQKYDEEYNVYFGVSTRYGRSGKKSDCYRVQAVWADLDHREVSDSFPIPKPDLIVDSGGGLHVYFLLESPVLVRDGRWERIEAINRGLCKHLGGDIAAIDCSRILRVPSYMNHKYDPPRVVKAYLL